MENSIMTNNHTHIEVFNVEAIRECRESNSGRFSDEIIM